MRNSEALNIGELIIREEKPEDYSAIEILIMNAFDRQPYSDQNEHLLVQDLRETSAYIPTLALVAEYEDIIIGHILLTEIQIIDKSQTDKALALAPVSVLPEFQHQGVGSALIKEVHQRIPEKSYASVILLGHEHYYKKFGYELAENYNIRLPFDVPTEFCQICIVNKSFPQYERAVVQYSQPFYTEYS